MQRHVHAAALRALDGEIRNGRLARLSSLSVRPGRGYFLMRHSQRSMQLEVEQLHNWIASYLLSEGDKTSVGLWERGFTHGVERALGRSRCARRRLRRVKHPFA
jgi:hypothetical protein